MTPTPAIAHLPRAILSVAVVLTLATGCSNPEANAPTPPSSEPTSSDARPTLPDASAPAIDLRAAADYSRRHQGDGLLVLRNGITVHSDFRAGMGPDTPHLLASGTKSFSGVAAAFAVSDGLLRLDEKVSDTITEWQGDPAKRDITVRQLLSLSAGIAPLSPPSTTRATPAPPASSIARAPRSTPAASRPQAPDSSTGRAPSMSSASS
jgi:CubicO group peptidase (beta-lactamase class C family)